jgi:hypothetical protein
MILSHTKSVKGYLWQMRAFHGPARRIDWSFYFYFLHQFIFYDFQTWYYLFCSRYFNKAHFVHMPVKRLPVFCLSLANSFIRALYPFMLDYRVSKNINLCIPVIMCASFLLTVCSPLHTRFFRWRMNCVAVAGDNIIFDIHTRQPARYTSNTWRIK